MALGLSRIRGQTGQPKRAWSPGDLQAAVSRARFQIGRPDAALRAGDGPLFPNRNFE